MVMQFKLVVLTNLSAFMALYIGCFDKVVHGDAVQAGFADQLVQMYLMMLVAADHQTCPDNVSSSAVVFAKDGGVQVCVIHVRQISVAFMVITTVNFFV